MTKNEVDEFITKPVPKGYEPPMTPNRRDEGFEKPAEFEPLLPFSPDEIKPGPPVRTKRRFPFVGAIIGLLIIGGLGFVLYRSFLVKPEPSAPRGSRGAGGAPQSVGVATVGRGDINVEIEALGTVTPLANVTVKTQINGQLIDVGFKEGQIVKKGDFLAQIDQRPYEALEHQYEGQLVHDQGLLDQAQFDLSRYQTLAKENSIARQTFEDQQFIVEQDKGTVRSDQALIEAQKLNIVYCHITAPVSGRVGLRQVDPGNYVQTTDTNGLVVLTQLQPISVVFSVAQNSLPQIADAMKQNPQLDADAYDQADVKKLTSGHLQALDNVIDTTTGMLKARALFDNEDDHLFPNQFVNIHLKTSVLHDVVTMPSAGVQHGSPGTFAYVVDADNKVSVRKITLGPTQDTMVAVTSGLEPGDRVVTDGSDRLREGASVIVPGSEPSQDNGEATPKHGHRHNDKQ